MNVATVRTPVDDVHSPAQSTRNGAGQLLECRAVDQPMRIRSISVFKTVSRRRIHFRKLATDTGARNYSILETPPHPLQPTMTHNKSDIVIVGEAHE